MKEPNRINKSQVVIIGMVMTTLVVSIAFLINIMSMKTVHISGTLAEKSLDDLFEQSALVVTGNVSGKSNAFQIKSVSGSVANFTDYQFTIDNALRGFSEDNVITIRVQGGTVGNYTEICEFSPDLVQNHEYLLFLYKPGRGGAYNTAGNYYYILGLTQGAFEKDETGNFVSFSGESLRDEVLISSHNAVPVDEGYFRNEYIDNQRKNLENGFITQEEYDELMANIDQYATIVK